MSNPATTTEGGGVTSMAPDVCYLPSPPPPPAGPGGIPTPYVNTGDPSTAEGTTTKVYIRNKLVLVDGATLPSSRGDEQGCSTIVPPGQKGLSSMKNMDKIAFDGHSAKVYMQGKGTIHHTVNTKHNAANTMGMHDSPSQTVVHVG